MAPEDWKKITLLLRPEMVDRLDKYRRQQNDLPDRNEAIRRLLEKGLTETGIPSAEQ